MEIHLTGKSTVPTWTAFSVPDRSRRRRLHTDRVETGPLMLLRAGLRRPSPRPARCGFRHPSSPPLLQHRNPVVSVEGRTCRPGRACERFVAEPNLYLVDSRGRRLTPVPFLRCNHADSRRTHADLRQADLLRCGEIGDGKWKLARRRRPGGSGESPNRSTLVDIVNPVDRVEPPGGGARYALIRTLDESGCFFRSHPRRAFPNSASGGRSVEGLAPTSAG